MVIMMAIIEKIISHLSRKLPLAFNTLPFTTANITIGNESVGSGSFAKSRNVAKCTSGGNHFVKFDTVDLLLRSRINGRLVSTMLRQIYT
jgi:hypothetical protein